MEKFIRNKTATGCGSCPYLSSIGECNWGIRCSHKLTYTYNNTDDKVVISPVPWRNEGTIYINNEETIRDSEEDIFF